MLGKDGLWIRLSLCTFRTVGISRTARGDAGDHPAAGGGPVGSTSPQRPVRVRAPGVPADQRGAQEEGNRLPAEDPEGPSVASLSDCLSVCLPV